MIFQITFYKIFDRASDELTDGSLLVKHWSVDQKVVGSNLTHE